MTPAHAPAAQQCDSSHDGSRSGTRCKNDRVEGSRFCAGPCRYGPPHETQPGARECPAAQYGGCGNADCGPCNAMGMAEITDGLGRWLTEVKARGYVAAPLRLPPRGGSTEATSGGWPSWVLAERAAAPADPRIAPRRFVEELPGWLSALEGGQVMRLACQHCNTLPAGDCCDKWRADDESMKDALRQRAIGGAVFGRNGAWSVWNPTYGHRYYDADNKPISHAEWARPPMATPAEPGDLRGAQALFRPGEIAVGESWVIDDPVPLGPLAEEKRKAVVEWYGKHEPLFRPGDLHYSGVAVPEEQAKDLTFEQVMALANGDNDAWEQACAAVGRAALTTGAVLFGSDKPGPATVVAAQQGCAAVEADTNIRCTNSTRPGYAFCDGKCRFVAPIEPGTKCSQCWLPAVVRDGAGYACCSECAG